VATKERVTMAGPSRPLGTPEIPQFHLPGGEGQVYAPRLYGAARVHFADRRRKVNELRRVAYLLPLAGDVKAVDWDAARATPILPDDLVKEPEHSAMYLPLPAAGMELKAFTRWAKAFDRWLARTQKYDLPAKPDAPAAAEQTSTQLGPKRGGVTVELVAIVWELT
jgi:hypothetical protein